MRVLVALGGNAMTPSDGEAMPEAQERAIGAAAELQPRTQLHPQPRMALPRP